MKRSWFTGTVTYIALGTMLLPIPVLVWLSFFKQSYLVIPPRDGYSAEWYLGLSDHPELLGAFGYSVGLAVSASAIATALGLLGAFALRRGRVRRPEFFESYLSLPLAVPGIVMGIALFIFLFNFQTLTGTSLVPGFGSLLAAHVLIVLPWTFRLIYAGLAGSLQDIERASMSLGWGKLGTIWHVTLPMLRTSIMSAATLGFIFSFIDLEASLFLVGPGKTTLPVALVQYASTKVDPTLAAIAVVQLIMIAIVLWITNRVFGLSRALSGGIKQ